SISVLRSQPLIIIDHHQSDASIDFASVRLNAATAAATAEVIYELARQLNWEIPLTGLKPMAAAILSDSLGLTADYTSARTVHIIGEMVQAGVSLSSLENARRETSRKSPELVHYKGELLQRIEYFDNDSVAMVVIPWSEIETYSPLYNPPMLALEDMRLTTNTKVALALKLYPNGQVTAKIRSNYGSPVAAKLAEHFGGGGHDYASGFKLANCSDVDELKSAILGVCRELLG
ncbi:MAG: DHH family phosphoesterase, partial [Candidatus Saccharimonadales bacterium]